MKLEVCLAVLRFVLMIAFVTYLMHFFHTPAYEAWKELPITEMKCDHLVNLILVIWFATGLYSHNSKS